MCGIFGFTQMSDSVRAMLPFLGIQMQSRGRDAWGGSNGDEVIKVAGPLVDSWAKFQDQIFSWDQGILHTRGASHGSPRKVENAHPFVYHKQDGSRVIGIHNGIISNHAELDKKYQRQCEVDSMHLWMSRAEGKPWTDMEGWGNLAWWETKEGKMAMHLARFNSYDLQVVILEGGEYLFCSELEPLKNFAQLVGNPVKTVFHIDEYVHYILQPNDEGVMTIWKGRELPFPRPKAYTVPSYAGGTRYSLNRNTRPACIKCRTVTPRDENQICEGCMNTFINQFELAQAPPKVIVINGNKLDDDVDTHDPYNGIPYVN